MRPPLALSRRLSGFSLLETLVALTILGMALLMTLSLLWQEPWAQQRLAAHEAALGTLEATLERLRAGASLPPVGATTVAVAAEATGTSLLLLTEVEALSPPGLFRVRLLARYQVGQGNFERAVETLVWRPPA